MRLSIYLDRLIRKDRTINPNVGQAMMLDCLYTVKERHDFPCYIIDENKIDGRVLGNVGVNRMEVLGNVVVRQWRVEDVIANTRT